ncbi:hypothetical protein Osc2_03110 [Ruminococcus sp. 25CYCFAH16]
MENNKQQKNTALIRIILCVVVMIILFLGIFKIVSRKITLPVSSVLLIAVAIWNGIEYFKSGKKKTAAVTFIMAAVLLALLAGYFISLAI